VLSFKYDESVRKSVELSRLIDDAVASDRPRASESARTTDAVEAEAETVAVESGIRERAQVADPEGS
jgi:hypothetical protein